LRSYRAIGDKVYVGQHAVHRSLGRIAVGDEIVVHETKNPQVFTSSGSSMMGGYADFKRMYHSAWD
jgi:hypothetical protein